jgi:AraC-like DNA-binding protein
VRSDYWPGRPKLTIDHRALTAPYFETEFHSVPCDLALWISYASVNRPTGLSRSYVYRRLPEATVHVALVFGLGSAPPRLLISGPQSRLWRVPFPADEAIDIALTPSGAKELLGVPLQPLTDQIIDAEELWGDSARRALEQSVLARSTRQRMSILFQLVRTRRERVPDRFSMQLSSRLVCLGGVKVAAMAAELGYSERQLRRKCLEQLGLAPKELSRILRIRAVLRQLAYPVDWARCASEFGYCDQAHLIHEFREFVGASPKSFLGTVKDRRLLGLDVALEPK